MSDFFEIFNPGARHAREYRDAEKMLVVEAGRSGSGPDPLDLDAGTVVLKMPDATGDEPEPTDVTDDPIPATAPDPGHQAEASS